MPVVQTITLEPGVSTGWHYHPGRVDVVVLSGVLTRTLADRSVVVSGAGESLVEEGGPEFVHVGRNLGVEPVVLVATYQAPEGRPLAVEVPVPRWARIAPQRTAVAEIPGPSRCGGC
ncbi:cupin domain-containing protein [Kitasatospora sp. McL0602]|uniref:cupin domain-containing protein n=1 Tax=Kitasatospora sp. McL0602 TaxID=3439530 RepID=UPI003F8BF8BC